ncbi:phosphate acyltransferase [Pseudothermotoga hypogea DSM 11164 = NBRC 106472]|uniref:Phosphate acyltransferase n=1 Tax=Pseudothermotoga hypogea DSM 11164 = NBRC 106472 TaxID=1123384 RepID=A0A0X1KP55_9THEM|nr:MULTISPECIES: phosphate acyltransferase PlsX [Pseudothermotoga]AJC73088.1 phosphate acyltransferase [Pseudothermotoga hypogea DSM 11164 = NBRC 106472]MBC7122263.1 phosphate acyltransferase PlsX [Pseudothermotoga sp.]MDI6861754.1 phosphate acyltransferase PlsX [Pseudothermotoga sp.]
MPRIGLDVMGGDKAPVEIVEGARQFLADGKAELILVGTKQALKDIDNVEKVEVNDFLPMDVRPTEVLRRKNSSMYVGLQLLKEKKIDAFVSAGNTGALFAGATFVLGRIEHVDRPALAVPVPSLKDFTILIDAGANVRVRAEHLLDFAVMGLAYAKVLGKDRAKLGLLNVGEEENKGDETTKEAYELLRTHLAENFAGNVEGHDINAGKVDVVVCDGFSGNVAMKTMEGTAKMIVTILKEQIKRSSFFAKLGALMLSRTLRKMMEKLDPRTYGGGFILGVNGLVIKAHGSSDRKAIKNALEVALKGVQMNLVEKIAGEIARVRDSGAGR